MEARKTRQHFGCTLLVSLLLCSCTSSISAKPSAEDEFAQWLVEFRSRNAIVSLSVLVLRNGEIIAEEYLGNQDDEFDFPTTERTSYYIASVTKPISGTALFLADAERSFELDRAVTDSKSWKSSFCNWFPESSIIFAGAHLENLTIPEFSCEGLTFRNVINMRSNGDPGSAFLYNPVAFANLSRAYEDLTSDSFRDLLRDRIFSPAGMSDTAAGWRDSENAHVLSNLAMPFAKRDGKFSKQPLPDDDLRSAAGLYMTGRDLARFDKALDSEALMTRAQLEEMWTPPKSSDGSDSVYVNGWYIQNREGSRLIWHGGWQPEAYSAIYLKLPDQKLTLIALANTEGLHWGNPLNAAEVEKSELVSKFLSMFPE